MEGFSYVGRGYCLDENQEYYSAFVGDFDKTDPRVCLEWCAQIHHPNFVGVEIDYDYNECWCNFSGGLPDDITMTEYNPPAGYTFSYGSGRGPIQTAGSVEGVLCYRYHVSFRELYFEKQSCRIRTPLVHIVSILYLCQCYNRSPSRLNHPLQTQPIFQHHHPLRSPPVPPVIHPSVRLESTANLSMPRNK